MKRVIVSYTPANGLLPASLDVHTEGTSGTDDALQVLRRAVAALEQHAPQPTLLTHAQIVTVDLSQIKP